MANKHTPEMIEAKAAELLREIQIALEAIEASQARASEIAAARFNKTSAEAASALSALIEARTALLADRIKGSAQAAARRRAPPRRPREKVPA